MRNKIIHFFDKLEDGMRAKLSRNPILYAFLGGIGVVMFWRGVWHTADDLSITSLGSLVIGSVILLITGVFVSAFIGNRLIISGLSGDKKLAEKAQSEIETEEAQIKKLQDAVERIEKDVKKIEEEVTK